jgi:hypothetical protein
MLTEVLKTVWVPRRIKPETEAEYGIVIFTGLFSRLLPRVAYVPHSQQTGSGTPPDVTASLLRDDWRMKLA